MVQTLASRLNPARFRCAVVSLTGGGALTGAVRELGLDAETLDLRHPLQIGRVRALYRFMKSRPFRILQTFGLRADLFGRILGRAAGIPVIIGSIRSTDPWRRPHHVLLDRLTLPLATAFISNSEAGRKSRIGREHYRPDRIEVIYNGIEIPDPISREHREAARDGLGIPQDAFPVAAHVANLRPMKGHGEVIRAAAALRRDWPRLRIICAGRDDSGGAIAAVAAREGVSDIMHFTGAVPDPRLVLQAADLFLLPSYWEGCPASLLEAMSCGLPCIASAAGGIPEIISDGENGLLIPPRDASALAGAVARLAGDPALSPRLGASARETVRNRFSLEAMVHSHEGLYHRLLSVKK